MQVITRWLKKHACRSWIVVLGIMVMVCPCPLEAYADDSMPSDEELARLVQETLQDFALSVNARDFTNFYGNIAQLWQAQTSPEELYGIFKVFSDQAIDLTVLQDIYPLFSVEPYIDEDGVLRLQGYYATNPSVTYFELAYLYEHPEWKLSSIKINTTPFENEELQAMVGAAMYDFALAVNAGDFTDFYDEIAQIWQVQTTPEELSEIFKVFTEKQIDLTGLQEIAPVFNNEPEVDGNGILILQGYFPSQPPIVYFTLKYIYEGLEWKLFGINVNIE